MTQTCTDINPLQRDGATQMQRLLEALDPEKLHLMDLKLEDWLHFAYDYAEHINYFDVNTPDKVSGNWTPFWIEKDDISDFVNTIEEVNAHEPHLALFIAFIKLLEHSKEHFNKLTKRHLDHYFKSVLQLKKRPPTPDKVHLIFELAQNVAEKRIPKGTRLKAGKDAKGKERLYATDEEGVINKGKIAHLRTIYHETGKGLFYAPAANSLDGLGADLPEDIPKWSAFGSTALPHARIGFALASPILHLKEGIRTISVLLQFQKYQSTEIEDLFEDNISLFLTGEKEWLGPFIPQGMDLEKLEAEEKKYHLGFEFKLGKDQDPVVPYQSSIHGEHYNTKAPILRFLFNVMPGAKGYELYQKFEDLDLKKIQIKVSVKEMQEMIVENDVSLLNASKPFYPFGPVPTRGSSFYIGNEEIFNKNWSSVSLNINWKDRPVNLSEHYAVYLDKYLNDNGSLKNISKGTYQATIDADGQVQDSDNTKRVDNNEYFKVRIEYLKNKDWQPGQINQSLFQQDPIEITPGTTMETFSTPGANSGKKLQSIKRQNYWHYNRRELPRKSLAYNYLSWSQRKRKPILFKNELFKVLPVRLEPLLTRITPKTKKGFIRLILRQDFFHKAYPKLLQVALSKEEDNTAIPNLPYTPEIERIALGYQARAEQLVLDSAAASKDLILKDYDDKKIQLFHEHPFGQTEEHIFLKEQFRTFEINKNVTLVPSSPLRGQFLIGLKNLKPQQSISLLVQVAEGSENPLQTPFSPKEDIKWSVLCSNEWKPLESGLKLADTTNKFLASGILKFSLPAEASTGNTILEEGFYWLRATINKPPDVVCQLLDIRPQAISATFFDQANDLSHLQAALPAETISKLEKRIAGIKKVIQPYNSFGGYPAEEDNHFYVRVSERLRHKNRAVTIWDYEHLILEAFPSVYKVKCLNHTKEQEAWPDTGLPPTAATVFEEEVILDSELAPGHVTLVVIPDTRQKNAFARLKPMAGQQLLTSIEEYLSRRHSLHVQFNAVNPEFEEVELDLKVQFKKDYDKDYYKQQLNKDLIAYLSPWSVDNQADISFGEVLYQSVLIHFIESREYVDFIKDFKIEHRDAVGETLHRERKAKISATNSRAILVSSISHKIEAIEEECITTI